MYSVKTIVIKVLGNILKSERPAVSYIFNLTLINNFTGLLLLPLLVLVSYLDSEFVRPFFYLAFAVLSISFIYRQVRALRIWYSLQGVSFFYLILYICTLEISPLLILIRLARG